MRGVARIDYRQGRVEMRSAEEMIEDWEPRFWAKVVPESEAGCWLWDASRNSKGYGRFGVGNVTRYAHRLAYELIVGPIPCGLEIDHLCRTPGCVNPAHLEAVTHRENVLRGTGASAANAKKVRCVNGHAFAGDNVRINTDGERVCVACKRAKDARYARKKRVKREGAR